MLASVFGVATSFLVMTVKCISGIGDNRNGGRSAPMTSPVIEISLFFGDAMYVGLLSLLDGCNNSGGNSVTVPSAVIFTALSIRVLIAVIPDFGSGKSGGITVHALLFVCHISWTIPVFVESVSYFGGNSSGNRSDEVF